MGERLERTKRALHVARVARRTRLLRVLREVLSYGYTQLEAVARMPRRLSQVVSRLEDGTLTVGFQPTRQKELEAIARATANRLGAALVITGLLVSSALMARANDTVALVGFVLSALLGLYWLWKIIRTPGDL